MSIPQAKPRFVALCNLAEARAMRVGLRCRITKARKNEYHRNTVIGITLIREKGRYVTSTDVLNEDIEAAAEHAIYKLLKGD